MPPPPPPPPGQPKWQQTPPCRGCQERDSSGNPRAISVVSSPSAKTQLNFKMICKAPPHHHRHPDEPPPPSAVRPGTFKFHYRNDRKTAKFRTRNKTLVLLRGDIGFRGAVAPPMLRDNKFGEGASGTHCRVPRPPNCREPNSLPRYYTNRTEQCTNETRTIVCLM